MQRKRAEEDEIVIQGEQPQGDSPQEQVDPPKTPSTDRQQDQPSDTIQQKTNLVIQFEEDKQSQMDTEQSSKQAVSNAQVDNKQSTSQKANRLLKIISDDLLVRVWKRRMSCTQNPLTLSTSVSYQSPVVDNSIYQVVESVLNSQEVNKLAQQEKDWKIYFSRWMRYINECTILSIELEAKRKTDQDYSRGYAQMRKIAYVEPPGRHPKSHHMWNMTIANRLKYIRDTQRQLVNTKSFKMCSTELLMVYNEPYQIVCHGKEADKCYLCLVKCSNCDEMYVCLQKVCIPHLKRRVHSVVKRCNGTVISLQGFKQRCPKYVCYFCETQAEQCTLEEFEEERLVECQDCLLRNMK